MISFELKISVSVTGGVMHNTSLLATGMRPWDSEFTDTNGRGRVALASFVLGFLAGSCLILPILLPSAMPFGDCQIFAWLNGMRPS